jgi:hypothetical protein
LVTKIFLDAVAPGVTENSMVAGLTSSPFCVVLGWLVAAVARKIVIAIKNSLFIFYCKLFGIHQEFNDYYHD